jgi:endonuclease/exonuclease/phosphatase (EEP) superfamily protein YafD
VHLLSKIHRMLRTATGVAALVGAGCALGSRYLPVTNHATFITSALSPYVMLGASVSAAALLFWGRHRILGVAAIGLTVATVAVQVPLYIHTPARQAANVEVRVMSANLHDGSADADPLVRSARERADVVALQELTPDEAGRLADAGIDATFPYRLLDPREDAGGTGMWSRFPISTSKNVDGYTFAFLTAQIRVPNAGRDATVAVAHMAGPWPRPIDNWRRDLDRLPATLSELGRQAGAGPVIVAADLNSTTDMRPFRALLVDGYGDAAEQAGAGIRPTFPADSRVPPFAAIDHVLTRHCAATSLDTLPIPGSDHRGLVTTISITRSSAGPGPTR